MPENNEGFQNLSKNEAPKLPKHMELKNANNPLNIVEGEYASGNHLKVTDLANCLGVGLRSEVGQSAVAAHIGPFGGEKYYAVPQINEWANGYVDQNSQRFGDNQPSSVIIRSREIGSTPLFHGRMTEALKRRFPDAQIDMKNGTDFEITF